MLTEQNDSLCRLTKEKDHLQFVCDSQMKSLSADNLSQNKIYINESVNILSEYAHMLNVYLNEINHLKTMQNGGDKLKAANDELKSTISDVCIKNENLKKVNIQLSELADDNCFTVKELNKNIVELREKNAFFEMQSNKNHEDITSPPIETEEIFSILKEEKDLLIIEIESLKNQMEQIKNCGNNDKLKEESYASLERQFNRLRHENTIIESKYDDLSHKNVLLSEECNTIGEYVHLYVSKRVAMKLCMEKVSKYLEDMQFNMIKLYHCIIKLIEFLHKLLEEQKNCSKNIILKNLIQDTNFYMYNFLSHLTYHETLDVINCCFKVN
ncbi:hypothetical protein HZS_1968 [Henneguya salminicola]|nr:hypothetical protein HZS_1968 [Henneguya salminicola]